MYLLADEVTYCRQKVEFNVQLNILHDPQGQNFPMNLLTVVKQPKLVNQSLD